MWQLSLTSICIAVVLPFLYSTLENDNFFKPYLRCEYGVLSLGAAYAHAEVEIRQLVERCGVPFLATPMGKGVVSDDHSQCVAAARSRSVSPHSLPFIQTFVSNDNL